MKNKRVWDDGVQKETQRKGYSRCENREQTGRSQAEAASTAFWGTNEVAFQLGNGESGDVDEEVQRFRCTYLTSLRRVFESQNGGKVGKCRLNDRPMTNKKKQGNVKALAWQ